MVPAAGFLLGLGVAGLVYGLLGRVIAQDPPSGYRGGAGRARALVGMAPLVIRIGTVSLIVGGVLLALALA